MKRYKLIVLWCGVFAVMLFLNSVRAAVRLPPVFGDHMVLQRDAPILVWGGAEPGEKVTVKLAGQEAAATAGANGRWQVKLAPLKASSQPLTMAVVAGTNTLAIRDVLIGDVWLCSGQSNMRKYNSAAYAQDAGFPLIRHFVMPHRLAVAPLDDLEWQCIMWPSDRCNNKGDKWTICDKQNVGAFTAVGFYFARKVHQATGVPIGLINVAWELIPIEVFLPQAGVEHVPELKPLRDEYAGKLAKYRQAVADQLPVMEAQLRATRQALAEQKPLPLPPQWPRHPSASVPYYYVCPFELYCLYNGMIAPLTSYAIKGVLWYQGEGNARDTDGLYSYKLRALIEGWRAAWGAKDAGARQDFPFYYVQLAYGQAALNPESKYEGWARIQQAQTKALAIPRTGMAVAIDIGNANDPELNNKKDVGERLALWALKNDYGQTTLECSGPLFREMKVEGTKARIFFDHTGSGLMVGKKEGQEPVQEVKNGKLQRFAVAGSDGKWVSAEAMIDGNTVVVSSADVPAPTAVRYAYASNPEGCNLYNRESLPAAPFCTDNWE